MRRREFIAILGCALPYPLPVRAQQPLPVVGFLNSGAVTEGLHFVKGFRAGLNEVGFIEGRNVAVQYRWANGDYARLPDLANELVREGAAVMLAGGGGPAGLAAKAASTRTAIVFITSNPISLGLAASYNRPTDNATGIDFISLGPKRLEILRELLPQATTFAILVNPTNPTSTTQVAELRDAARNLGIALDVLSASNEEELAPAFGMLIPNHHGGMLLGTDPFFSSRRRIIVELASRHSIPAIY